MSRSVLRFIHDCILEWLKKVPYTIMLSVLTVCSSEAGYETSQTTELCYSYFSESVSAFYIIKRWMQTISPFVRTKIVKPKWSECKGLFAGWPYFAVCASLQLTTQGALTLCAHTPGPVAHNQCSKQHSPSRHLSSATAGCMERATTVT